MRSAFDFPTDLRRPSFDTSLEMLMANFRGKYSYSNSLFLKFCFNVHSFTSSDGIVTVNGSKVVE